MVGWNSVDKCEPMVFRQFGRLSYACGPLLASVCTLRTTPRTAARLQIKEIGPCTWEVATPTAPLKTS